MTRSVLIADDEPNARQYMTQLIESRPDLKLVATLSNGQEVLDFCRTWMPDILLLDIEMPGVTGMEVARSLSRKMTQSIIIFSTAYDQYAIAAFEVAAVGYLLKPFSKAQFNEVMDRANDQLLTINKAHFSEKIQTVWDQLGQTSNTHLEAITIKEKGLIRTIKVEEIIYFESDSEYVKIHARQGTDLQRIALNVLTQQLPPAFHRIHRSIILNACCIVSHKYLSDNRFQFTMSNGAQLTSSRSYQPSINQWLTS